MVEPVHHQDDIIAPRQYNLEAPMTIILTTLNARFSHSALGLRYLLANMGELQSESEIIEFTIQMRPIDIAEKLLAKQPKIIGIGVYIWNIEESSKLVAILKQVAPEIKIVLGGPEVSFEHDEQPIVAQADYVMCGLSDRSFGKLCRQILNGPQPLMKIHPSDSTPITDLTLPYTFYTDDDIKNRVIYVEASRGCPFKCEFCLSSLDKTAYPFELDAFLAEMERLYERGARQFKFVDRTFNLKVKSSIRIMEFFLDRLDEKLFLHFELIPDHLPEPLKEVIKRFPAGSLQFEIGVQSFNPKVQHNISRRQDNQKSADNILWLSQESHAHMHTDLIIGLPGEDISSIQQSFDTLVNLTPHEIQVGILKRLRGTPLIRHTETYQLRFNPHPPYNILSTNLIDFATMQRLSRFTRYWDLIANSGRFPHTLPLILADSPFNNFLALSDWLFTTTRQTHKIALPKLFEYLHSGSQALFDIEKEVIEKSLLNDFSASGIKGYPKFLNTPTTPAKNEGQQTVTPKRQSRHLNSG